MPNNTIGICGESPSDMYPVKSTKWLKYISQAENINIKHACNGNEPVVMSKKVDGYCKDTNTIYQFHGCYWHGCKACYDGLMVNRFNLHNMKYLYKRTMAIDAAIRAGGYKLITIREHEFDKNKEMRNMKLDEFDLVEPPKIRDGFYEGRCEPVKLIYNLTIKNVEENI